MSYIPQEIVVHDAARNDPTTRQLVNRCPGVPVKYIPGGLAEEVRAVSTVLPPPGSPMLETVLAGKRLLYVAPPSNDTVDRFSIDDHRLLCPHFDRLKLASNGCPYRCDWCFLKGTYRGAHPFMTVRVGYDEIKAQLKRRLDGVTEAVFFNTGELADSLALEHLTDAARSFIPWFAEQQHGRLFMLTKSDNVDGILGLDHGGHTTVAWSINNAAVSRRFEIGAPSFDRRLAAAAKVQQAGYPLRIRLDPIVPIKGWKRAYATTIRSIFERIKPERVTLGTLRFEETYHRLRHSIFQTGAKLCNIVDRMVPMFEPVIIGESKKPRIGKYSFAEDERVEMFTFALQEIRRHSNCPVALCKESAAVWNKVGLDLGKCACVCQLGHADMRTGRHG